MRIQKVYGPSFMNERRDNLGNSTSGYEICWQQTSFFLYDRSAAAIEWSIIKNLIRKNCNGIKRPYSILLMTILSCSYLNFFFMNMKSRDIYFLHKIKTEKSKLIIYWKESLLRQYAHLFSVHVFFTKHAFFYKKQMSNLTIK